MEKNLNSKNIISVVILLIIALASIFAVSNVASSSKFHAKTIKALDEKKVTVMELTAATAGTSTAIALIPSDATTPLANQIIKLSSYLLIVIGAIFLEKILLTLTGYITFTFLIPISCLLYGIYLFAKKQFLRNLAIKLSLFGIVIFIIVPISVKISDLIENTYQTTINQTIEDAKSIKDAAQESTNNSSKDGENTTWWGEISSKVTNSISSAGDNVSKWIEKWENKLSNFIDAIAILIITSCVIPIIVLFFFIWIIKIIFGISIPTPNTKKDN